MGTGQLWLQQFAMPPMWYTIANVRQKPFSFGTSVWSEKDKTSLYKVTNEWTMIRVSILLLSPNKNTMTNVLIWMINPIKIKIKTSSVPKNKNYLTDDFYSANIHT